jgi:nitrogen regulatory protein P-II 2
VAKVPLKRCLVYVKPFKLEDVVAALAPFSLQALVVSECRGYGRQKGHLELYEGSEYQITFLPKVRLEFVASAFDVEQVVEAICRAARTGRIGDGKIFVSDVRATEEDYA